jgi:hypothetical protein
VSHRPTLTARDQAARRAEARELLDRPEVRCALTGDRDALCSVPGLASAVYRLRAELVELLSGIRCCGCGTVLDGLKRRPEPGGGPLKCWSCEGKKFPAVVEYPSLGPE